MTEGKLYDHARLKGHRRSVHPGDAFAFENDHDLGELLLDVRSHAAATLELAGQNRTEWRPGVGIAQIPHQHGTVAAEQTLAAIMGMGPVPHGAFEVALAAYSSSFAGAPYAGAP
jgi:hypothetical protein